MNNDQQLTQAVRHVNKHFGYSFNDHARLKQALTHRSAAKLHNERLEFLGDAILGMVIAELLYQRFPDQPEGKLTRMRASLVKGVTLANIAQRVGLGDYLFLGPGEMKSGGHRRASILADVVEAILGAIYLDSDMQTAQTVTLHILKQDIDALDPDQTAKDSKTQLQEFLQSRKLALPSYEVISVSGKEHDQTFVVSCQSAASNEVTKGSGPSRRRAEQDAALQMLSIIQQRSKS